jgi:2'-5' RNA ligase
VRTFISIDLSANFQNKLADVQSKFSDFNFRFIDPCAAHITMKFLGELSDDKIIDISNAIDNVQFKSFDAHFKGIGVFPKAKHPKVLWIGCHGNFSGLHKSIEKSLYPFGFGEDSYEFNAHITLARVRSIQKKQNADFLQLLAELKDIDLGFMHVHNFRLKKSILTPEGPRYETLHEVSLK